MKQTHSWVPEKYKPADARAVQDLEQGKATPDQQKRVLNLVIRSLACTYHPSYRDNERDTIFMEGRRFVGLELINLLNLNAAGMSEGKK